MTGYAKLEEKDISKLKECEDKMNVVLLAVEKEPKVADLSAEALKTIQDVESKIGVTLVAYE